jgi:drug/metabolite transporter (DMT)-like permease
MKTKGYLCAIVAVLIWSGFILVSRMGGVSPLTAYDIIAIRYVSCSVFVFPFWLLWRRFNLFQPKLIICSFIGGLAYALCAFNGFKSTPASHAAVLLPGLLPISIALLSTLLNKERHSAIKWLGILMITFGIMVLFWYEFQKTGALSTGHVFLVGAAVCWAKFSVLINRWKISPWEATVSLAVITGVVYTPVYLMYLPKNISMDLLPDIGIQVVYQGFLATIVQLLFYVRAVQLIGAANMGSMMAIVPILAGFSAIYIFDERLSAELVFALLGVSLGVWIANLKWNPFLLRQNLKNYLTRS